MEFVLMSSTNPADQPYDPSVAVVNGSTSTLSVAKPIDTLPPIAGTGVPLDQENVPYNDGHGHGTEFSVTGCSTSGSSATLSTEKRFTRVVVGQTANGPGIAPGTTVLAVASNFASLTLSAVATVSANSIVVFV